MPRPNTIQPHVSRSLNAKTAFDVKNSDAGRDHRSPEHHDAQVDALQEAVQVAERMRSRVALADHEGLPCVTISCGVATYPEDAASIRELTTRADDGMYAAKAAGRNAVRPWRKSLPG